MDRSSVVPGRRHPAPFRRSLGILVAVIGLVVIASGCAGDTTGDGAEGDSGPRKLSGVVQEPAPDVSTFSLPEATAQATPFPFVAGKGQLLLVYFGYTSCPDVCPTTLADLKAALKKLGDQAGEVSLAMTTIDPRRDSAEVISSYVRSFVATATALRTEDDAALRAVTTAFGASYQVTYPDDGEPEVAHSAYTYVVDDRGRVVLQWPFGTTSNDIALDLAQLLA